jgi:phosphate starvation-inducible protein PhoH
MGHKAIVAIWDACQLKTLRILPEIKGIDIIYLSGEDVVRHKLVRRILEAYGDIQK